MTLLVRGYPSPSISWAQSAGNCMMVTCNHFGNSSSEDATGCFIFTGLSGATFEVFLYERLDCLEPSGASPFVMLSFPFTTTVSQDGANTNAAPERHRSGVTFRTVITVYRGTEDVVPHLARGGKVRDRELPSARPCPRALLFGAPPFCWAGNGTCHPNIASLFQLAASICNNYGEQEEKKCQETSMFPPGVVAKTMARMAEESPVSDRKKVWTPFPVSTPSRTVGFPYKHGYPVLFPSSKGI